MENTAEIAAAIESIMPVKSIFDPIDAPSTAPSPVHLPSSLHISQSQESSDEEARNFILKYDGFVPRSSKSETPRVKLRKMPRVKNVPKCTYTLKRGTRKGDVCGTMCKLGEQFCAKHKLKEIKTPASKFNLLDIAIHTKFNRLKVSKKYKLLQSQGSTAIFENTGRLLKVRLPKALMPIPKTGSYLKYTRMEEGSRNWRAMWE